MTLNDGRVGVGRAVWALSLARLGDAIGNSLLFVALPLYVARIHTGAIQLSVTIRIGLLLSVFGFVSASAQPMSGAWIDRRGHRKRIVQLGLLVMAVSLFGYILADRYFWLLGLRGLQGIGVALTVPAALSILRSVTYTETRGGAMGVYSSMRMLGIGLGPLIGGFLIDRYGFIATFIFGALCIGLTLLLVQLWVQEPEVLRRASLGSNDEQSYFPFFSRQTWSPEIVGASLSMFTMAACFTLIATLERQFNHRLETGAFLFAVAFSSYTFSRLLFQFPVGWLSDRCGRKPMIVAGLLLLVPTTALQGWASSLGELLALRIGQGLASAGVVAPALALAGDAARSGGQGRQMSITTMGFSLGMAVGPLIAGLLVTALFALPFLVAGGLSLFSAWIVYRYTPETVRATSAEQLRPEEVAEP